MAEIEMIACLPVSVAGRGSDLIKLEVEVRFTSFSDRLGLGIREESLESLDVCVHVSRQEDELTYRWLAHETAIQFRIETGVEIDEKHTHGLHSYFHGTTVQFDEEILLSLPEIKSHYRFRLIHTGPIVSMSDDDLLLVAAFVGPNPNQLARLAKVSSRFKRVFSRDEVWAGAEPYIERAYNNSTAGLSPGISSQGVNSWLRDESGLPLSSASRVRWVALTSSRFGIYLGSIESSRSKTSMAKRFYNDTVSMLADNFSGPTEYLARLKQSLTEPWQQEQNLILLGPGPKAQLLLDCLQFCLPKTANRNAIHVKAALKGYQIVDRPIQIGADGDRVTTRLELPHEEAKEYLQQDTRTARESIVARSHSLTCIGDERLILAIGAPCRATVPRTAAHILTISARLPVSAVLDKLPDTADAATLLDLIPRVFLGLPEKSAIQGRIDKELRQQWHQNVFSSSSSSSSFGISSSGVNTNSNNPRPVLVLLVVEGLGRRHSHTGVASNIWADDKPRDLSRGVGELPTKLLQAVPLPVDTIPTSTTSTTAATAATSDETLLTTTLTSHGSSQDVVTLEDIFRREEQRKATAKEAGILAQERAVALREFQVSLVRRVLVKLLLQSARDTLVTLTDPRKGPSHHPQQQQQPQWGAAPQSPVASSSGSAYRSRSWHVQAVNGTALNYMAYTAGSSLSSGQRKTALCNSGLTCGVNALIRMITNNNSVSRR